MTNRTEPWAVTYIGYVAVGLVVSVPNYIIALCILRYMALRRTKEYIYLMALSVADAVHNTAFIFGGAHRLFLTHSGTLGDLTSSYTCFLLPQCLIWGFSGITNTLMLLLISCDRLISVACPLYYITLTHIYAQRVVGCGFGVTIGLALVRIGLAVSRPAVLVSNNCHMEMYNEAGTAIGQFYIRSSQFAPQILSALSILVFSAALPVYRCRRHHVGGTVDQKRSIKQQRKITKSIAFANLCTLFVYLIPLHVGFVAYFMGKMQLAMFLALISNMNGLANVFVYALRHSELRMALRSLFRNKEMPPVLNLWRTKTAA